MTQNKTEELNMRCKSGKHPRLSDCECYKIETEELFDEEFGVQRTNYADKSVHPDFDFWHPEKISPDDIKSFISKHYNLKSESISKRILINILEDMKEPNITSHLIDEIIAIIKSHGK